MKKIIFTILLMLLLVGNSVFASDINTLIGNKVITLNGEYDYDAFSHILDNSNSDIIYKSLVTNKEINSSMNKDDILNYFSTNNFNAVKILYVDTINNKSVVFVDFYKNNAYKLVKKENKKTIETTINETKEVETIKETNETEETKENDLFIETNDTKKGQKYKVEFKIKKYDENGIEIVESENVYKNEQYDNISTGSYYVEKEKNVDYVDKVFKNTEERLNIDHFVYDLNNEEYQKIYNDISEGKYKIVFNVFLNNYNNLYSDFDKLFKQDKYKEFFENIKVDFDTPKYKNLLSDIDGIIKKYGKKDEFSKYKNKNDLKIILNNLSSGEYNELIKDIDKLLKSDKYKDLISEFYDSFLNGEYSKIFYDFVYNFLDITYKYEKEIEEEIKKPIIKETKKEEVKETIKATESVVINDNKKKDFNITSLIIKIAFGFIIIALIFIAIIFILKLKKKIKTLDKIEDSKRIKENEE